MKRNLMTVFVLCLANIGFAQTTLPNLSFEQWQLSSNGRYNNPSDGIWATPNKSLDFALPGNVPVAPVQKVTDAQSGSFAALLYTTKIFNILAPGTLYTGKFEISTSNPNPLNAIKLGTPFTAKPDRFKGYFKYAPMNGDSCLMYAFLTKHNTTTNQRDTVALAQQIVRNSVNTYTGFDLPFEYQSTATPDSITIVFTSSAGGNNLQGQEGSQMWVDNVSLEMSVGIELLLMPEVAVELFPNPTRHQLTVKVATPIPDGIFSIYNSEGKKLEEYPLKNNLSLLVNTASLAAGNYFYTLHSKTQLLNSGILQVQP